MSPTREASRRDGATVRELGAGMCALRLELVARPVPDAAGGGWEVALLEPGSGAPVCVVRESSFPEATYSALAVVARMRAAERGWSDA